MRANITLSSVLYGCSCGCTLILLWQKKRHDYISKRLRGHNARPVMVRDSPFVATSLLTAIPILVLLLESFILVYTTNSDISDIADHP